ncbi:hypothetical protein N0V86_003410 [Didymella sp. IMI 355093]|nr:hypothetical protein N0V86_003410 [Didymella sp. IMI 355093]
MSDTGTKRYHTLEAEHKFMFDSSKADHEFIKTFVKLCYSRCTSFQRRPTLHFSDNYYFSNAISIELTIRCRTDQWQAKKALDFDKESEYNCSSEPFRVFEVFDTYEAVGRAAKDSLKEANDLDDNGIEVLDLIEQMAENIKTRREQFEIDGVLVNFDFFDFDPDHCDCNGYDLQEEGENHVGRIKILRRIAEDQFEQERHQIRHDLTCFIKKYKVAFCGYNFDRLGLGQEDSWCRMRRDEEDHLEEFAPFSGSKW